MRGRSERTRTSATSKAWRTPFLPSRMPASIELSIKLGVCLSFMQSTMIIKLVSLEQIADCRPEMPHHLPLQQNKLLSLFLFCLKLILGPDSTVTPAQQGLL